MKKLNIKSITIKIFILLIFVFVINAIKMSIMPIIQNQIAMMQMENTAESYMAIQLYLYIKNYSWIVIVFIAAMLFIKEIKIIFNKVKETFKDEKN